MNNKVVFAAAGNGKTYNICKEAISKGYTDGTKGGFEERLKRLQKKQDETKK